MMRTIFIGFIALGLLALWACEENPAQDYGRALTGSVERTETAADTANLEALKKSIAAHYAATGSYPESLEEIAQAMGLDPSRYAYDPGTGKVAYK